MRELVIQLLLYFLITELVIIFMPCFFFPKPGAPKFPTPVQFHFLLRYAYYVQQNLTRVQTSYDDMTVSEIRNRGEQLGVDFKGCIEKSEFVDKLESIVQKKREDANKAIDMVKFTLKVIYIIERSACVDNYGSYY